MLDKNKLKDKSRIRRHRRVRSKVSGDFSTPRLCVFRSLNHIYVQAIDDVSRLTLVAASDLEINNLKVEDNNDYKGKTLKAYRVGILLAQKLKDKKIEKAVFDKSSYKYHGRVKVLAQGVRDGGIKF